MGRIRVRVDCEGTLRSSLQTWLKFRVWSQLLGVGRILVFKEARVAYGWKTACVLRGERQVKFKMPL